jgi:hypothetical protein
VAQPRSGGLARWWTGASTAPKLTRISVPSFWNTSSTTDVKPRQRRLGSGAVNSTRSRADCSSGNRTMNHSGLGQTGTRRPGEG